MEPLCVSFKFPHHSGFMPSSFEFPSDLHIHSSFEFRPKLRSVSILPSAFTDSVTLSVGLLSGALLKSQASVELDKRPPGNPGLCLSWSEGLWTSPPSPTNPLLSSSPDVTCSGRGAPGLRSWGK
ncbi:unnamed protein product [Pipistrellus nathusii]|uniref:Uncharacterized protein n=1 Tax=Pipistrellus nathusii TaxID=59473 RepID=A0ABP0A3E2_PIPNA